MIKLFNEEKFVEYMVITFPSVFGGNNHYEREWLENMLQWVIETYEGNKDTIIAVIDSMLPEVTEEEISQFWE